MYVPQREREREPIIIDQMRYNGTVFTVNCSRQRYTLFASLRRIETTREKEREREKDTHTDRRARGILHSMFYDENLGRSSLKKFIDDTIRHCRIERATYLFFHRFSSSYGLEKAKYIRMYTT